MIVTAQNSISPVHRAGSSDDYDMLGGLELFKKHTYQLDTIATGPAQPVSNHAHHLPWKNYVINNLLAALLMEAMVML